MKIQYSEVAVKQLKKIKKGDPKSASSILQSIENYAKEPGSVQNIKILKGKLRSFKRLRSGNYRVIFDEDNRIMYIYYIKHRKEAYDD